MHAVVDVCPELTNTNVSVVDRLPNTSCVDTRSQFVAVKHCRLVVAVGATSWNGPLLESHTVSDAQWRFDVKVAPWVSYCVFEQIVNQLHWRLEVYVGASD